MKYLIDCFRTQMIKSMIDDLECHLCNDDTLNHQSDCLIQGAQSKVYQPLMKRITCGLYDNKNNCCNFKFIIQNTKICF